MTYMMIALAAVATTIASLAAVHTPTLPVNGRDTRAAQAEAAPPRLLSTTADGRPILLARVVVTATPLER